MPRRRFWVKRLDEIPLVPTDDPNDFDWYPIQHHLWINAFGVNVYGGDAGTAFVHEHNEMTRRTSRRARRRSVTWC